MSRLSRALVLLVGLAALVACSEHSLSDKAQLSLVFENNDLLVGVPPVIDFQYVDNDVTRTLTVMVRNLGQDNLIVEAPTIESVDWVWAAQNDNPELSLWPFRSLAMGGVAYTYDDLFDLVQNTKQSDASIVLGRALLLANLVIESGGDRSTIADTMEEAEAWLEAHTEVGDTIPLAVSANDADGQEGVAIAQTLLDFVADGNDYLSFDPGRDYLGSDFPLEIAPDDDRAFDFQFAPEDPRDARPMMVRISSNDGFDNDETFFMLRMDDFTALAKVTPSSWIVLNPSVSSPGFQTFAIDNEGTGTLEVSAIELEFPNIDGYELIPPDKPSAEWYVLPKNDAGRVPLEFSVRYAPTGDPEGNTILVRTNDPTNEIYRIPVSTETQERAEFEVTYDDQSKGFIDFIGETGGGVVSKIVSVRNVGPANFTIQNLTIDPEEGEEIYELTLRTVTGPDEFETHTPPYSLRAGRTAEVVVTYWGNPDTPVNATLIMDYLNPTQPGHYDIPIFAGDQVPVIEMGPTNGSLHFTAGVGEQATATMVIANDGNGELTIHRVALYDDWYAGNLDCETIPDPPDDFALADPFLEETVIQPFSLVAVPIVFSPALAEDEITAHVQIVYDDPLAAEDDRCKIAGMNLFGRTDTTTERPVAQVDLISGTPTVGELVVLDAGATTSGAGEIWEDSFTWWLGEKPAGSKVVVNETTTSSIQFQPDMVGTYRVYLTMYSIGDNSDFLYCDETYLDISVQ